MEGYAKSLVTCPRDQIDNIRQQSAALVGEMKVYGQLKNMEFDILGYSDVLENEANTL